MCTVKRAKEAAYKPVLDLLVLPYEQFVALRGNIAVHGVLVPILVDSEWTQRGSPKTSPRVWTNADSATPGFAGPDSLRRTVEERCQLKWTLAEGTQNEIE